ncbi:MAG: hypothetical protein DI582_03915 [Azospirillum brasilense]|nr:MAG: hypothetical protein DI582_03915 [Azospirillum brasilense]
MSDNDHYKTLGVERTADEAAIKSAYRKLAKEFHPDKVRGLAIKAGKEGAALDAAIQEGQQAFQRIGAAYDVLGDTAKRANYDRNGHAGVEAAERAARARPGRGASSSTARDPFEDIFGKGWRERASDPFAQRTSSGSGTHAGAGSASSHGAKPGEGARANAGSSRARTSHDFMHDAEEFTHRYEGSTLRRAFMTFDVVDVVLLGALVIGGIRQWREATKKAPAPAHAPAPEPAAAPAAPHPAADKPLWQTRVQEEPVPMYKQRTL